MADFLITPGYFPNAYFSKGFFMYDFWAEYGLAAYSLISPGIFHNTIFLRGFWADGFWLEYGTAVPPVTPSLVSTLSWLYRTQVRKK